jgi:tripartite ATP-independent transporter DctM subunit
MTIGLICLGLVLLLAFMRVPLGIALLTVSVGGITFINNFEVAATLLPMTLSEAAFSYELAVVPLFILMGNVLSRTGISADLFRAANAFLGGVRGGLALATMVTCAGFSAVCGSSFATAATMSKVAYPSMQKYGYSDRLASATIAAGGTLGILIPPSIILMIYGILTQQNIGELFIAGVLPGLLGLAMYMAVIYIIAVVNPEHAPRGTTGTARERWESLSGVWPFLALFLIIIGGLYGAGSQPPKRVASVLEWPC